MNVNGRTARLRASHSRAPAAKGRLVMTSMRYWAAVILLPLLVGCSGPPAKEEAAADMNACIIGGSTTPMFALSSAQLDTIVRLTFAHLPQALCSGVRLDREWVLTAGHCVEENPTFVEHERSEASTIVRSVRHADFDVGLLQIHPWQADSQLARNVTALDRDWIGDRVQLAGYGLRETGGTGALRFAVEPIVDVTTTTIVVDGKGRSGACLGDSGGPMLARADDGSLRVVGVLDRGSATCVDDDVYTRVDVVSDWIAATIGRDPAPLPAECGSLTSEGECYRNRAAYCSSGQLRADGCGPGGCGWTPHGFRCLRDEPDPCEGVGPLGQCEGDDVLRCERGRLARRACSTCGLTCAWSPASGRAECTSPL